MLSIAEKIKIILGRRKMTVTDLAALLGQSRQNFSQKLSRDNFTEKEFNDIAKALNCSVSVSFVMNDTGEVV